MGGFPLDRFIADAAALKPFICGICKLVLRIPTNACKNEHVYCRDCIREDNPCPGCRLPIKSKRNAWLCRTVDQLECKCAHHKRGCTFRGPLNESRSHRKGDTDHYTDGCPFRDYACPKCRKGLQAQNVRHHLKEDCPEVEILCPNSKHGCLAKLLRKNLQDHTSKHCRYVPCGQEHDLEFVMDEPLIYKCYFVGPATEAEYHAECREVVTAIIRSSKQHNRQILDAQIRAQMAEGRITEREGEFHAQLTNAETEIQQLRARIGQLELQLGAAPAGNAASLPNHAGDISVGRIRKVEDEDQLRASKRPRRSCTQQPRQYGE